LLHTFKSSTVLAILAKKKLMLRSILFTIVTVFSLQAQEAPNDYLTPAFHADRRAAVRAQMPPNSVAVFFANPVRNRANDVDYHYHQDPNFYYLTGLKEPHAVLLIYKEPQVVDGVAMGDVLFVQERDPLREQWDGYRLGIAGAKEKLGFPNVFFNTQFNDFKTDFERFDQVLFFDFNNDIRDDARNDADLFSLLQTFREKANFPTDFNVEKTSLYRYITTSDEKSSANVAQVLSRSLRTNKDLAQDELLTAYQTAINERQRIELKQQMSAQLTNLDTQTLPMIMDSLREIKLPEEVELLKKAIYITAVGQVEVMKAMHPNMSEREIQGIHEFVFKKYGAEYEGYPSIVGGGHNGCVLHYITNDKPKVGEDLVLMDLGAEYHNYTADVTRTIPADGTFSAEQRAIYDIVYEAQEAGIAASVVGAEMRAPHYAAVEVIVSGLKELGIIQNASEARKYFPHGTSHYLGLDVHDAGTYSPFQHNTLITVEPGIYIPENSPCDRKWWGIAVRIEDDILITNDGPINLSAYAPRTADEIEAMMREPSVLDAFVLPELDRLGQ
jgi:Xaa-Pro aminopeptidase